MAEWWLGAYDRTARQIGQDRPGKENIRSGVRTAKRRLLVGGHPGRDIGAKPVVSGVDFMPAENIVLPRQVAKKDKII